MPNRSPLCLLLILAFVACSRSNNPPPAPPPVPPVNPPTDTTHPAASNDSLYWQVVSPPNVAGAEFSDIWFTDTLHGIVAASDGYIYTSSDGGSTWIQTASVQTGYNPDLQTLFFLTPSQGYVIGTASFAVTTNGGQNWTIKARPDHVQQIWPNLQFLSPSTGYLATGAALYKTVDTGTTWTAVEKDSVSALFFANVNTGSTFSYPNKMSNTGDGGNTWMRTGTVPTSSSYRVFCFLQYSDAQHGWFLDSYRLSVSGDGGATWQTVFQASTDDAVVDLQLLSGQSAYMASAHHLYRTMNGGATWQQEYTLPSTLPPYAAINVLFFTDDHHGWACGSGGLVLRYRR